MKLPELDLEVGTIFCIGRNYAEHAAELGNPVPASPIVFLKPRSAISFDGTSIVLPRSSTQVQHEVEIVIAIGSAVKMVSEENALSVIAGYAVGIDVTARDTQNEAKKQGHPWTFAKGLPTFAPVSRFVAAALPLGIELRVNGELRQQGESAGMLWPIPKLIAFLASTFNLLPGDLIFTGTPKGVAALKTGDRLSASLFSQPSSLSSGSTREVLSTLDLTVI